MTSSDDRHRAVAPANPGPFVLTDPCPVCDGQGAVDEQPCPACHGTGVGRFLHGTKADLKPGDLIGPGYAPNFGDRKRTTAWVYLTGTLDAATWGAELALGEGLGRVYVVEPTGPIVDDPNLTDQKFPGNPTRSYRSREPLRVIGELTGWQGHTPEAVEAMKRGVEELRRQGFGPMDDSPAPPPSRHRGSHGRG